MDTYADTSTSYRADLAYRREQLIVGLDAARSARRARRGLRSTPTPNRSPRTSGTPARAHVARSA